MKAIRTAVQVFLLSVLALQLFFILRIGSLVFVDAGSTAFQRTGVLRMLMDDKPLVWAQHSLSSTQIPDLLKQAVIASEDSGFSEHNGVEWDAIERAYAKNGKPKNQAHHKMVGGSTITQQLAKNLFLSGERHFIRKAQELLITFMLEACLSKDRILTLYLNHVEWGRGIYGVEAASLHYFHVSARSLNPLQAARLAAMLPRPRYFELHRQSAILQMQAARVLVRMYLVELP